MPRVDVYEQDNTIVVTAELPGLTKDAVQVELDDDDLVIRGKTQAQREVKEDAYYRAERSLSILISRPRRNAHKSPRAACNGVREDRVPPLVTRLVRVQRTARITLADAAAFFGPPSHKGCVRAQPAVDWVSAGVAVIYSGYVTADPG
jgi:hypothetical protein